MTKRSQQSIARKQQRAREAAENMLNSNGMRAGGTLFCHAGDALAITRELHPNNADLIAYLEEVSSRPNEGVVFKDGKCWEIREEDKI